MSNPQNAFFGKEVLSEVPFYLQISDDWYEYYTYYNADGTYFNFTGCQMNIFIEGENGQVVFSSSGGSPTIFLSGAVVNNILFNVPQSFLAANFVKGKSYSYYLQLTDSLSKKGTLFKGTFFPL